MPEPATLKYVGKSQRKSKLRLTSTPGHAAELGAAVRRFLRHRASVHAVIPAVRVGLWKDDNVERVHDCADILLRERSAPESQTGAALIGLLKLLDEVNEDVGAA